MGEVDTIFNLKNTFAYVALAGSFLAFLLIGGKSIFVFHSASSACPLTTRANATKKATKKTTHKNDAILTQHSTQPTQLRRRNAIDAT